MPGALDASALLAYLQGEPGADVVGSAMAEGLAISAVNLAETLTKLADAGQDPDDVCAALEARGILGGTLLVEPFTQADATTAAKLRLSTIAVGLSVGDRACLALARRLGKPALTADRLWSSVDAGITVQLIR